MPAVALIKFVQGSTIGPNGQMLVGTLGNFTVQNSDNTGVLSWQIDLIYVPPGSVTSPASPFAANDISSTPTATIPADVSGSWRCELKVWDVINRSGPPTDTDIRVFGVREARHGTLIPCPQITPPPINESNPLKPNEFNLGGTPSGWAGNGVNDGLLNDTPRKLDAGVFDGLPVGSAPNNGFVVIWNNTLNRYALVGSLTLPGNIALPTGSITAATSGSAFSQINDLIMFSHDEGGGVQTLGPLTVNGEGFFEGDLNVLGTLFPSAIDRILSTTTGTNFSKINGFTMFTPDEGGGVQVDGSLTVLGACFLESDVNILGALTVSDPSIFSSPLRTPIRVARGPVTTGVHAFGCDTFQYVFNDASTSVSAGAIWRISPSPSPIGSEWFRFINLSPSQPITIQDPSSTVLIALQFVGRSPYAVTVANISGVWTIIDVSYVKPDDPSLFAQSVQGTSSFRATVTPAGISQWAAFPAASGAYTALLSSTFWTLNTNSGNLVYNGPTGKLFLVTMQVSVSTSPATQVQFDLQRNSNLQGTTTATQSAIQTQISTTGSLVTHTSVVSAVNGSSYSYVFDEVSLGVDGTRTSGIPQALNFLLCQVSIIALGA